MRKNLVLVCMYCFLALPLYLQAAPLPDSGLILQEQKQAPTNLPERLPASEDQATEQSITDDDLKIEVSGFKFTGMEAVATEAELQKIVKPAIGQKLSLADLRKLIAEVTNYLRDKGFFLARAYLPKQEIIDGIVQITIIAGQVEGPPTIILSQPTRINEQVISSMATDAAPSGEALQQKQLERSLLLMNDLPSLSAISILEKGTAPGTTRVIIEAQEGPLFNGLLSFNNFGNRYNGTWQAVAQAAANDLSGFGDQLSLSLTGSEGLMKGSLAYQLPLGSSGLKGSLSYTGLRYQLGKEFKSLDAEGTADTFSTQLSYPIIRGRTFSLWQELDYEYRSLQDEIGGTTSSERTLHVVSANTRINGSDRFAGGGLSNVFLQISAGDLEYDLAAQSATDAATARAEGGFLKLSATLSRLQRLTQKFTLFGAVSGQLADQNLDSSEKFILGGPSAVRAYPVGEAAGDEGYSLTAEVRYDLPRAIASNNLQCVAFFDTGRIKLHDSPWTNSVTNASGKNSYAISGMGIGVNLDKPGKYSIRASYAHTIGNNPGRNTDGDNADNKDNDQQVWLQAILWF